MKKLLFLYNPHSGQRIIKDHIDDIIDYFSKEGYFATVYASQDVGDCREKIMLYGKEFDEIIVSGGDGTLDEVVSGILKAGISPVVGYIPTGSTNDFAKSIKIETDITEATHLSINGQVKELDIGCMDDKYFTYVAAFGSLAEVSYGTDQAMKNIFGRFAYILEGVKTASNLKSYKMKVNIDGEEIEDEFIHGMVTNSVSVGGFTNLVGGNVSLDDGIFEVMLVKKPNGIVELNQIINGLTTGRENKLLIHKSGRNFKFSSNENLAWTLDGEYGGEVDKTEISIKDKALKIRTGFN